MIPFGGLGTVKLKLKSVLTGAGVLPLIKKSTWLGETDIVKFGILIGIDEMVPLITGVPDYIGMAYSVIANGAPKFYI